MSGAARSWRKGERSGQLTLSRFVMAGSFGGPQSAWVCECDCGQIVTTMQRYLTNGSAVGCRECRTVEREPITREESLSEDGVTPVFDFFGYGHAYVRIDEVGDLCIELFRDRQEASLCASKYKGKTPDRPNEIVSFKVIAVFENGAERELIAVAPDESRSSPSETYDRGVGFETDDEEFCIFVARRPLVADESANAVNQEAVVIRDDKELPF